jgi:hypothetical protein
MKTLFVSLSAAVAVALPALAQSSNGNCSPPLQYSFVFNSYTPNSCNGETVLLSEEYFVNTQTCTYDDGSQRFRVNTHSKGTGVGVVSGTDYIESDQIHAREYISSGSSPSCPILTEIETIRRNLISKGAAPNQQFTERITASIDADCNFTFNVTPDTDCTGSE